MEEPNKVQKRKRDRLRDQGSTVIYLKAIQGILGKSMPNRKGEAANARVKPSPGERPSREGPVKSVEEPARSIEGPVRSVTVTAPQEEKESSPEVRVEEEKPELDRSNFCDRRVVIEPQEKLSEEPLGDRRTVIDNPSPLLEFLDDSDSHLDVQKVSKVHMKHLGF
jgi:TatD DNase family protein